MGCPDTALDKINEQRQEMAGKEPQNLEEQWGQKATALPAFIIRWLPIRLTYDNNYFNDSYQGIPIGGYT